MKSPFYFIVEPVGNRRYDNTTDIGGIDFITSTSKEDHTSANRLAKVISTPNNYKGEITIGDVLVVHHNVFKFYNDMRGREKSGKSFISDNQFLLDEDQWFMAKHNGLWKCHSKYCFVRPIEKDERILHTSNTFEPLTGIIAYGNKELSLMGVNEGDKVSFTPDSEYEFNIDGEILYRMLTNNITIQWTQNKLN